MEKIIPVFLFRCSQSRNWFIFTILKRFTSYPVPARHVVVMPPPSPLCGRYLFRRWRMIVFMCYASVLRCFPVSLSECVLFDKVKLKAPPCSSCIIIDLSWLYTGFDSHMTSSCVIAILFHRVNAPFFQISTVKYRNVSVEFACVELVLHEFCNSAVDYLCFATSESVLWHFNWL